ncbi:MAG: hypothetical protein K1X53_04270 [Candidatus Sumerlaeaceae bacterium]|nr:hypothetical protein [Candidatus Sumerlaeaceae bacterium]
MMRLKGHKKIESPEKLSVETAGIEMKRGTNPKLKEKLTGGNQPADETGAAELVTKFIRGSM